VAVSPDNRRRLGIAPKVPAQPSDDSAKPGAIFKIGKKKRRASERRGLQSWASSLFALPVSRSFRHCHLIDNTNWEQPCSQVVNPGAILGVSVIMNLFVWVRTVLLKKEGSTTNKRAQLAAISHQDLESIHESIRAR
jgi:hypothetical protein